MEPLETLLCSAGMAITSASTDEAEELRFTRPPVDRLFLACVLAACLGYVAFLIVMALVPREPEDPAKQSYLGVVTGESQPLGGGPGEDDPATGVAVRGGAGSAHYAGGGRPRPVVLIDGELGSARGASKIEAGEAGVASMAKGPVQIGSVHGPGGARLGSLLEPFTRPLLAPLMDGPGGRGLEVWLRAELEQLDGVDGPVPVAHHHGQRCTSP